MSKWEKAERKITVIAAILALVATFVTVGVNWGDFQGSVAKDIDNLSKRVEVNNNSLSKNSNSINEIERKLQGFVVYFEKNQKDINELGSEVSRIDDKIEKLNDNLNKNITGIYNKMLDISTQQLEFFNSKKDGKK
jgi:methyl-accepting chemotaxis protein